MVFCLTPVNVYAVALALHHDTFHGSSANFIQNCMLSHFNYIMSDYYPILILMKYLYGRVVLMFFPYPLQYMDGVAMYCNYNRLLPNYLLTVKK